jgi:hypothetical protein
MKKILALAIVFAFFKSYAQKTFSEMIFGDNSPEKLRSVFQHQSSDLFTAGYAFNSSAEKFNITLHKLDDKGNLLWSKLYERNFNQYALSINPTFDGNIILCGEAETQNNGLDFLIMKIDSSGNPVWTKIYGGNNNQSANYIEQTKDSGYVICGFTGDSFGSNDVYLAKADAEGNLIWEKTFGGPDNDYGFSAQELDNGDFIVTSDSRSFGAGGYDVYLLRLNASGEIIWEKTFGDRFNNGCQGIMVSKEGYFFSYGETEVYDGSPFDYFIEKIDGEGNSIWKRIFGGEGSDAAFAMAEGEDGSFYFTGYSTLPQQPKSLVIFKTDEDGIMLWEERFGKMGINLGYDIRRGIKKSDFFIVGMTTNEVEQNIFIHLQDKISEIGIARQFENKSLVYPNPVTDRKIYVNLKGVFDWKIYSAGGNVIQSGKMQMDSTPLLIDDHIISGIYFIEFNTSEGKIIKKINLAR